jgi:hypothetical protein
VATKSKIEGSVEAKLNMGERKTTYFEGGCFYFSMREPKENEKDNDRIDYDKMVLMMKKKDVFNFILIIIKIFYKIGIIEIKKNRNDQARPNDMCYMSHGIGPQKNLGLK